MVNRLKKTAFKKGALGILVVGITTTTPIIPEEMELLYSYQYDASVKEYTIETPTTTITKKIDTYDFTDTDGDGKISVSVFADRKGNLVYEQIEEQEYYDMGIASGYENNTKKNELVNLFSTLTPKAEAAIAFDNSSSVFTNSATSLTWSHTTTGSELVLLVFTMSASARTVNSVTYNGTNMTSVNSSGGNQEIHGYILTAPSTGANNVVVTMDASTYIYPVAGSYTGAAQSGQPDANNTNNQTTTSITTTLTTVADNSWTVLGARAATNGDTNAGTGSTEREANTGYTQLYDSNSDLTPAGSHSMTVTAGLSQAITTSMISIAPALDERRIIRTTQF